MRVKVKVDGLLNDTQLAIFKAGCKLMAEEMQENIELKYSMAVDYVLTFRKKIDSIMDLDDDLVGAMCVAFDPSPSDACCTDDERPYAESFIQREKAQLERLSKLQAQVEIEEHAKQKQDKQKEN